MASRSATLRLVVPAPQLVLKLGAKSIVSAPFASTPTPYVPPVDLSLAQVIDVAQSGGDFTSLAAAVASISDASAAKPYVVRVAPGQYVEPPITMKSYVDVVGLGYLFDVELIPSDPTQHFVRGAPASSLRQLSVQGPTSVGTAAIDYQGTGYTPFVTYDVVIRSGYYGLWCHPSSYGTVHAHFTVNRYLAHMQAFFRCTGYGNLTAVGSSYMSGPPGGVSRVFDIEGPNTSATFDACQANAPGSDYCVFADDGAQVRLNGCSLHQGTNAIRVGPNGATKATLVDASGGITIASEHFSEDVGLDSDVGTVWIMGRARPSQFRATPGATIAGAVLDPSTNRFTVLGSLAAGSLDLTAGGIAIGTMPPLDPTTYAEWQTDHLGHWGFIDVS
jgi:hypothetical protein